MMIDEKRFTGTTQIDSYAHKPSQYAQDLAYMIDTLPIQWDCVAERVGFMLRQQNEQPHLQIKNMRSIVLEQVVQFGFKQNGVPILEAPAPIYDSKYQYILYTSPHGRVEVKTVRENQSVAEYDALIPNTHGLLVCEVKATPTYFDQLVARNSHKRRMSPLHEIFPEVPLEGLFVSLDVGESNPTPTNGFMTARLPLTPEEFEYHLVHHFSPYFKRTSPFLD